MSANKVISKTRRLVIGSEVKLNLSDLDLFTWQHPIVQLSDASAAVIERSYQFLQSEINQGKIVYGINTNFGDQARSVQKNQQILEYETTIRNRQINIVRSMACGLGQTIDQHLVRLTMLLRAHCLSQGYSGTSHATISALLNFLNAGITPLVKHYGSIGASGDLIPLGTIASALIGENVEVFYLGKVMPASRAISMAGLTIPPLKLRDGLSLINGTSFMAGIAAFAFSNLQRLVPQMLAAIAMTLEGLTAHENAYQPTVHQLKKHPGQCQVAEFFLDFWKDSQLIHRMTDEHNFELRSVQDYYSLRAIPQGFGPLLENLSLCATRIENEINSINDNPLIDSAKNQILHNANFMGYYITDVCDLLKMNIAQASTWIHALLSNLLHDRKNQGLPSNLASAPEKNGFRSFQLLAAALSVQNRKLAQAQQAFMLPTEGDNQDVNSLGAHAALDFHEAVQNLERLTAILLLTATQSIELRDVRKASSKTQKIYQQMRNFSAAIDDSRPMMQEIELLILKLKEKVIT